MKRTFFNISVLTALLVMFYACNKDDTDTNNPINNPITFGTMTDQEGNVYKTVTIGTQTWMAENLRTTKYNDGTPIPKISDDDQWGALTTGAYCNPYNATGTDTIVTYGRLYNWYAVNTGKLAPTGWHVPSDAEWTTLTDYLGGEPVAGGKLKETGTKHWYSPNVDATNETGFTALPAGHRSEDGTFLDYFCLLGYWWCTTESNPNNAWCRWVYHNNGMVYRYFKNEKNGFSIRCVKN